MVADVGMIGAFAGYIGHGLIGNSISGMQLRQEQRHHEEGISLGKRFHEKELEKAQELHENEIKEARRLCIAERNTEMKQHFQSLNADLINSNREAERDMYEQRNSQFQTIIVASTVMFGALCTVIIEGQLPLNTGKKYTLALMTCSGLSFAFLFVCMVLALKLILRCSRFMYTRASVHNRVVNKLANDTSKMLKRMDNDMKGFDNMPTDEMWKMHVMRVDECLKWRQDINDLLYGPRNISNRANSNSSLQSRSTIGSHLTERDFLAGQEDDLELPPFFSLNREPSTRSIQYARMKASIGSFETFWKQYCQRHYAMCLRLFYLGMVLLLVSLALLVFAKLRHDYNNTAAAYTFGSFLFLSVAGTVYVLFGLKDRIYNDDHEEEAHEDNIENRLPEMPPHSPRLVPNRSSA